MLNYQKIIQTARSSYKSPLLIENTKAQLMFRLQSSTTNLNLENVPLDANIVAMPTQEWTKAKHFNEVPSLGTIQQLWNHLPGGKYSNLDIFQLLNAMKDDLGSIFAIKGYLGQRSTIVTTSPEDFEKLFRNEGRWPVRPSFGGLRHYRNVHRKEFFQSVIGLLASQGQEWGDFRSAVNPFLLQPRNVRMYLEKMSQVNDEFLKRIIEIRNPETLEVPSTFEEEINRWALESISIVAFDKQLGLIRGNRDNPETVKLFNLFKDMVKNAGNFIFKPSLWKIVDKKSFNKTMATLDDLTDIASKYVDEAMQHFEEKRRLEGVSKQAERPESVLEKILKIDKKIAIIMALDMLIAGVDTTSSAFTGFLLCLAKNPEKQNILREELVKVLPKKHDHISVSAFNNMPYLRACLKESLRVYPLVSGITRRTVKDMVLSGYQIPNGTQISMVNIFMLEDDAYFPNASEFLPERWLRSQKKLCPRAIDTANQFIHIPFSYGPRSCVGQRIAEQEMLLAAAYLVRNFHIEFNHSTERAFKCYLFRTPNIPLRFKFSDVLY